MRAMSTRDPAEVATFPDVAFYHNKFRVLDAEAGEFFAHGGHGQFIIINRAEDMVCAVLGSEFDNLLSKRLICLYREMRDRLK